MILKNQPKKELIVLLLVFLVGVSCQTENKQLVELVDLKETIAGSEQILLEEPAESTQRFSSRKTDHLADSASGTSFQSNSVKRVEKRNSSVLGDMLIGSILFFAGFPCLWFNEKGYAYTKTFLYKYVKLCETIKPEEINPANENKLVCVQGESTTTDSIVDPLFDLSVGSSIRLRRNCQIYNWTESRHTRRISDSYDEVYYTYSQSWVSHFVDSRSFAEPYGHENDERDWLFDSWSSVAPLVNYGQFKLTETQKDLCNKEEAVPISALNVATIAERKGLINLSDVDQNDQPVEHAKVNEPAKLGKSVKVNGEYLVVSHNQGRTSTGDFRVRFTRTPCGDITVVGQQQNDTLETFTPEENKERPPDLNADDLHSEGCCACCSLVCKACESLNAPISQINWVAEERRTKQQMFQKVLSDYETKTWLFRLLGFLCFSVGIYLMLSPVYTFMYWFPFVGRYLGTLGSFICGLIGFLIAIPLSILTISIAWLFYRKEIGIPLLIVALLIIGYFTISFKDNYHGEETQNNQQVTTIQI